MRRIMFTQLAGAIVATGLAAAFAFGLSQSADAGVRTQATGGTSSGGCGGGSGCGLLSFGCSPNCGPSATTTTQPPVAVYVVTVGPTTTLPKATGQSPTATPAPPRPPANQTPGFVPPIIIPPLLLPSNPVVATTTTEAPIVVGDTVKIVVTGASFGEVAVGATSAPRDVTVSNQGNVPVPIKGAVTDAPFQLVAGAGSCAYTPSLSPGQSCTYRVTFTPTAPSVSTGSLRITLILPAANATATGSLDGRGGAPRMEFDPPTVDLGNIPVGVRQPVVVTLRNTGTVAITIASIAPAKKTTEATVAKKPCIKAVLAPGASCQVSMSFAGLAGKRSVTLIALGSKKERASLVVLRTGVKSGLTITPPVLDFGPLAVGSTSGKKTFTVTNTGGIPLALGAKTISGASAGDYRSPANTCGIAVLAPKAKCTIDVVVKPTAPGPRVATLTVAATAGKVKVVATSGVRATPPSPPTVAKPTVPKPTAKPTVPARPVPTIAPTVLPATVAPTAPPVARVTPALRMDPAVGVAGDVTTAIGTGFPANATVQLAWAGADLRITVRTDANGSFHHPVLVQRGERIGGRTMQALAQPAFDTVRAPYLVQLSTFAPQSYGGSNRLVTRS